MAAEGKHGERRVGTKVFRCPQTKVQWLSPCSFGWFAVRKFFIALPYKYGWCGLNEVLASETVEKILLIIVLVLVVAFVVFAAFAGVIDVWSD
ncbi:MAG: hypothetical protein NWF00_01100 [Candidatus Bathyarchaeota archaeon]|nr:hypothetical protein [Candidatus Bathyarchaeota archaeon]